MATSEEYVDDSDKRKAVHAYLSEHSHEAWQDVCDEQGVSVTAFIEALGLVLGGVKAPAVNYDGTDLGITPEVVDRIVKLGRRVDASRRRRG